MRSRVSAPLRRLAGTVAELKARVRGALAGETARAVAEAVRDVVEAVLTNRPGDPPPPVPTRSRPRDGWDDPDPDLWDEAPDRDGDRCGAGFEASSRAGTVPETNETPAAASRRSSAPGAFAAGVSAGRWWLRRRGSVLEAVGVGLLVALAVMTGGPVIRTGAATAPTATDRATLTDPFHAFDDFAARAAPFSPF